MSADKKLLWQTNLAESRAALSALLNGLTAEQWAAPVFSEGDTWTVKTVVSHLLDSERGMSIQVHKIRKGEETVPENFDLARWNAGVQKRVGDVAPAELIANLEATRAKTLEVMNSLRDEEWTRSGRHPARGIITIEQYYETIHGHELGHTADIAKALG
ncbi:MAG: DinB family protein [Caldilineaceae bacterium]|nr:DinB family protein [Caldilineaceae bacterium]MCB0182874.1 DinB family protein [Caldilineaceae bacterium]